MPNFIENGQRYLLDSPTVVPNSAGYLWNQSMMIHMNCQGYAVAQFMDPEPRKYAHVPTLAATSFMQPEQPYFAHHPGRFFYVRDNQTNTLFSAPFAPCKKELDRFEFQPGLMDIKWLVECLGIRVTITLNLSATNSVEMWQVEIENLTDSPRDISFFPYFPVGYMSWMNMGARYDAELNGIVCSAITPYQKVEQYPKIKALKDKTYFVADRAADCYETRLEAFEGMGGLHLPDAINKSVSLASIDANYEMPICCLQYNISLDSSAKERYKFLFGPAFDESEIEEVIQNHFGDSFENQRLQATAYSDCGKGVIEIDTPDTQLNHFVNHWLPRQVFYHGDVNRLTTDPQTRNYLQDGMGMAYVNPNVSRNVIIKALSQQHLSGEMPDGILLSDEAELKYINQVPHTDHAVWLTIILNAYLNETGDQSIFDEIIGWDNVSDKQSSLLQHMNCAMEFMIAARDERGLPYIAQGDWCDPMNMVGHKGVGVSGWLTQALCYSLQLWVKLSKSVNDVATIRHFEETITELKLLVNDYFWNGQWYSRGITDDGVTFGVPSDQEGRIFLNTQSWAFLANCFNAEQKQSMLSAVDEQLDTPYGPMLFAPAFTSMREDVGRVTQKWPGSAENGSVYNHAAAFYAASLYAINESDRAFSVMQKMLCDEKTFEQRGQLPIYIPNYFRGAYYQIPRTAGKSSNLFNTGTGAWFYQMLIEEQFGLKGSLKGLHIAPKLPSQWKFVKATRQFRGATFEVEYHNVMPDGEISVMVNGIPLKEKMINVIEVGKTYQVVVTIG
jgi:cellobionic acid phosphorylase